MQLVKYSLIGLTGTAIHYTVLLLLVTLNTATPLTASVAGSIAGAVTNHHLNRNFTFQTIKSYRATLSLSMTVAALLLLVNFVIMYIFVNLVPIHYLLAQLMATVSVFFAGFFLNKYMVFQSR